MACNLPHTVEQLQMYVKNQTDKDDTERQKAIFKVMTFVSQTFVQ